MAVVAALYAVVFQQIQNRAAFVTGVQRRVVHKAVYARLTGGFCRLEGRFQPGETVLCKMDADRFIFEKK